MEMIRRNVNLEVRLIDDLLDLTRIRGGKLHLKREAVDAHELIHRVAEICRDDLAPAGLRLALDLAARRHDVDADPIRLQQVLWNLLKNAIKFTPEGGTVTVRTRDGEAAPATATAGGGAGDADHRRQRHGDRDRCRGAAADLRPLRAGERRVERGGRAAWAWA